MRFVSWEPGLRAMFHGRPIFREDAVDLRDRRGAPLDPTRSFTLADDDAEMAHFLRSAGYLLVKGVFSPAEVDAFRRHGDQLRAMAREGDKLSWWARNQAGESILCRVTHAGRIPELRGLYRDARVQRLKSLSHHQLVTRGQSEDDGISLLIKNPEITEGLSDLPWHRDCGMGGHASMCPVLIASLYLWPSRPESGELRMLPGSHEASCGFAEASDANAPRGVSLAADPGDVSLHYGDIMHAAPPPTGAGPYRQCLLSAGPGPRLQPPRLRATTTRCSRATTARWSTSQRSRRASTRPDPPARERPPGLTPHQRSPLDALELARAQGAVAAPAARRPPSGRSRCGSDPPAR